MSRKSQETIGPNVDTPATTESNAFHMRDWDEPAQTSAMIPGCRRFF